MMAEPQHQVGRSPTAGLRSDQNSNSELAARPPDAKPSFWAARPDRVRLPAIEYCLIYGGILLAVVVVINGLAAG
jgi:hypothetical protein